MNARRREARRRAWGAAVHRVAGAPLGPYRSFFAARFRMLLQYRGAAFGGMVTQVVFGLILVMVYEAFYRSSDAAQPMSFAEVRSYIWLGQALLALLPWNVEGELRVMIRTGGVAYELLRPLGLYPLWFARTLASRLAPATLRAVPIFALALAFFGLALPLSPAAALSYLVATAGAVALGAAFTMLFTVSLLWTVSGEGITQLGTALVTLLSGMAVPIPLFPDALRPVLEFLPFRGLVDTPFRLYVGSLPPSAVLPLLGHQLAWTAVLVTAGALAMRRGLRRLEIQGG
ncbi:MAG: ABC-2 family transporter protein [Spirochaetes bacterium]|nr:ABC-2 family transporter protein [Spirochaetota bacterium]